MILWCQIPAWFVRVLPLAITSRSHHVQPIVQVNEKQTNNNSLTRYPSFKKGPDRPKR